jgi:FkbM family methyltransferase
MNDIKQVGGIWLPADEEHLVDWMVKTNDKVDGKLTYQFGKFREALPWVRQWRTAIDIGAHCGLWSMHMARRFSRLVAFEPIALHLKCFELNVVRAADKYIDIHAVALGAGSGFVALTTTPCSSADTSIIIGPDIPGEIPLHRLDDYDLEHVDFIKVDCNGYELPAMQGAEQTLRANRPCISIEQKPRNTAALGLPDRGAIDYLQSLGAVIRHEHGGVYVMSWKD